MAIRFHCGFCSQPIEVDDEWASKTVACPYCRKTITAPAVSTLGELGGIPTAAPLAGPAGALPMQPPALGPAYDGVAPAQSPPNGVALAAFVLACATLVLGGSMVGVLAAHRAELAPLMQNAEPFSEQYMEAVDEFLKSQEGAPPMWWPACSLLMFSAGICWIGALVCGCLGVRHPRRRALAVGALVLVAISPVLMCCGASIALMPKPEALVGSISASLVR